MKFSEGLLDPRSGMTVLLKNYPVVVSDQGSASSSGRPKPGRPQPFMLYCSVIPVINVARNSCEIGLKSLGPRSKIQPRESHPLPAEASCNYWLDF